MIFLVHSLFLLYCWPNDRNVNTPQVGYGYIHHPERVASSLLDTNVDYDKCILATVGGIDCLVCLPLDTLTNKGNSYTKQHMVAEGSQNNALMCKKIDMENADTEMKWQKLS